MMKILHITSRISMGGGYKFIKLVKEKLPHYQHILVGRPGELVSDARSFFGDKAIFILPGFFLADAIVIRKILKKIEPSVIHLHGRGAGLYGRLLLPKKYWSRTIYTLHGFNTELLPKIIRAIYLNWERSAIKKTKMYHFVSESEREFFLRFVQIDKNKTKIIYNCIEMEGKIENDSQKLHIEEKDVVKLLFVGRLSKQKGLDILLKSLKNISYNFILDIYGDGKERNNLRRMVSVLNLNDKVCFKGSKNFSEINVNNYDALVVPSRFEGMPFVVLEGIKYGLPIIATPARGIIDIIPDNSYGYLSSSFTPESFLHSLLNFFDDLHKNPEKVNKKRLRAYNHLKRLFNCCETVKLIDEMYSKVILGDKR